MPELYSVVTGILRCQGRRRFAALKAWADCVYGGPRRLPITPLRGTHAHAFILRGRRPFA